MTGDQEKLFRVAKKYGATDAKDLDAFNKQMSTPLYREQVYSRVKAKGLYDGDLDSFSSKYGYGGKDPVKASVDIKPKSSVKQPTKAAIKPSSTQVDDTPDFMANKGILKWKVDPGVFEKTKPLKAIEAPTVETPKDITEFDRTKEVEPVNRYWQQQEAKKEGYYAMKAQKEQTGSFTFNPIPVLEGKDKILANMKSPMEIYQGWMSDRGDQASKKRFELELGAVGKQRENLGNAIEYLNDEIEKKIGTNTFEYLGDMQVKIKDAYAEVDKFAQEIEKAGRVDTYNGKKVFKKTEDLKKYKELVSQAESLQNEVKPFFNDPLIQEFTELSGAFRYNNALYQSVLADPKNQDAQDFNKVIEERQKEVDEAYKNGSTLGNIARSGFSILSNTAAKTVAAIPQMASILSDINKPDAMTTSNFLGELANGIVSDMQDMAGQSSTHDQREFSTLTAKDVMGEYQVDFDTQGRVTRVLDKKGFKAGEFETQTVTEYVNNHPEIKIESKNNWDVLPYLTGQMSADLLTQVVGTKGLSKVAMNLGAANQLAGKIGTISMIAAQTIPVSYEQGIAAGLDRRQAALYAYAMGAGIGAIGTIGNLEAKLAGVDNPVSKINPFSRTGVRATTGTMSGWDLAKIHVSNIAEDLAKESFEEAIAEPLYQFGLETAINGFTGKKNFSPEEQFTWENIKSNTIVTIASTLLPGSLSSRTNEVTNHSLNTAFENFDLYKDKVRQMAELGQLNLRGKEPDKFVDEHIAEIEQAKNIADLFDTTENRSDIAGLSWEKSKLLNQKSKLYDLKDKERIQSKIDFIDLQLSKYENTGKKTDEESDTGDPTSIESETAATGQTYEGGVEPTPPAEGTTIPRGSSVEEVMASLDNNTLTNTGISRGRDGYSGDFLNDYELIAEGSEHAVYRSKDGTHVIKVGEPYSDLSNTTFEARIKDALTINQLIGDSSLEVIGYYESPNGAKNPVYKQKFIEGEIMSQDQVADHLRSKGFYETRKNVFVTELNGIYYEISDTSDNFIMDKSGTISAIDAGIIELSGDKITPELKAGVSASKSNMKPILEPEPTETPDAVPVEPIERPDEFEKRAKDASMDEELALKLEGKNEEERKVVLQEYYNTKPSENPERAAKTQAIKDKLRAEYSPEQADASMALLEAKAFKWAADNGKTVDEFYDQYDKTEYKKGNRIIIRDKEGIVGIGEVQEVSKDKKFVRTDLSDKFVPIEDTKLVDPSVKEEVPREFSPSNKGEFTSSKGLVVKEIDGEIVTLKDGVETKKGRKQALKEYAQRFDFTEGDEAELNENIREDKINSHIAETSNNPAELAKVFLTEEPVGESLSEKERVIAENGIFTTKESFAEFDDKNNLDPKMQGYFRSKKGLKNFPLDVIAQEMSPEVGESGVEITPQDLVDFMNKYPDSRAALMQGESEAKTIARERFKELTGLDLDDEIALEAVNQRVEKLSQIEKDLLDAEYNDRAELEAAYERAYAETDGFTKETNPVGIAPEVSKEARKINNALNAPDFSTLVEELMPVFESTLTEDEKVTFRSDSEQGIDSPLTNQFKNFVKRSADGKVSPEVQAEMDAVMAIPGEKFAEKFEELNKAPTVPEDKIEEIKDISVYKKVKEIFKNIFGLKDKQAKAAAKLADKILGTIAERAGVSKEDASILIDWQKATEEDIKRLTDAGREVYFQLKGQRLAPNGKPSNLSENDWLFVRTPEFKEQFGDWENDPKNASSVVDENGEPLLVYHGGGNFDSFSKKEGDDKGIYFTESKEFALYFAHQNEMVQRDNNNFDYNDIPEEIASTGEPYEEKYLKYAKLHKVFLVMRDPKIVDAIDARVIPKNYEEGKDGFIAKTTGDFGYEGGQYVVFDPDQIIEAGKVGTKIQVNQGLPLFQQDGEVHGAVEFLNDMAAIIYAVTNPNVSTPLHELTHVYEKYLTDAEKAEVENWSGEKSGTREFSEAFARGFERYLYDGVSPNTEMTDIFDKFRKWMHEIYQTVVGQPLNRQMQNIYANMLGVQEHIVGIPNPVGGTKEYTKEMFEAMGRDPLVKQMSRTWDKVWEEAMNNVKSGLVDPAQVVLEIITGGAMPAADLTQAYILIDRARISAQMELNKLAFEEAQNEPDPDTSNAMYVSAMERMAQLEEDIQKNGMAGDRLGTGAGQLLNFMKVFADRDYSLVSVLWQARKMKPRKVDGTVTYDKLTEEETKRFTELTAQLEAAQNRVNELEAKVQQYDDAEAERMGQEVIDELKPERKRTIAKRAKKLANQIRAGKIHKPGSLYSVTPVTAAWDAALEVTALAIDNGGKLIEAVQKGIDIIRDWKMSQADKDETVLKFKEYMKQFSPIGDVTVLDDSARAGMNKMVREKVEDGLETINEVVDAIYEEIKDQVPGLTWRDLRDFISGYGVFRKKTPNEVADKIREIKRDGRDDAALEDVNDYRLPKRTGVQRDKPTPEQRRKRAEILKGIKEKGLEPPMTEDEMEAQWRTSEDAYIARLENAIDDIQSEIDNKKLRDKPKGRVFDSDDVKRLQAEKQRKIEERDALLGTRSANLTTEQKIEMAKKATQRIIDKIQQGITNLENGLTAEGDIYPERRKNDKLHSAELDALRAEKDLLVEQRDMLIPQEVHDTALINRVIKSRQRTLAALEDIKARKDYAKKERTPAPETKEIIDLNRQIFNLKLEIDTEKEKVRLKNLGAWERIARGFGGLWDMPKALRATIDLSAPLRQGKFFMTSHPLIWGRAFGHMFTHAKNKEYFENMMTDLMNSEEYYEMVKHGLFLAVPNAKANANEEVFGADFLKYIKMFPGYGGLISGSERGYVGFLNELRVGVYKDYKEVLLNEIAHGADLNFDEEMEAYARVINNGTGRAHLGFLEGAMPFFNKVFWSLKFAVSRWNLNPLTPAGWLMYYNLTPRSRKQLIKDQAKFFGVVLSTLALIKWVWGCDDDCKECDDCVKIELDPRSSDFLKLQYGKLRIENFAGLVQNVRVIAQAGKGERKSTKTGEISKLPSNEYKSDTRKDVIENYVRGKLSPTMGLLYSAAHGMENAMGEPLTVAPWGGTVGQQLSEALSIEQFLELYRNEGIGMSSASIISFFGEGVEYRKEETPEEKMERKQSNKLKNNTIKLDERELNSKLKN